MELGFRMRPRPVAPPGLEGRAGLLFFGAFHEVDSPNYDSIRWFLREIWPHLLQSAPGLYFDIAGHKGPDVSMERLIDGAKNVRYRGRAGDLAVLMDRARVFVAPTRFAGGSPHKLYEAMAGGVPVVCTTLLKRQLYVGGMTDEPPVLAADRTDPEAFAEACLKLLRDDHLWRAQQKAALTFIREHASSDRFDHALGRILDAL
jgi:glycosyltransferase involved in cell wall biosynthesis